MPDILEIKHEMHLKRQAHLLKSFKITKKPLYMVPIPTKANHDKRMLLDFIEDEVAEYEKTLECNEGHKLVFVG